jgi:hypothetical protein
VTANRTLAPHFGDKQREFLKKLVAVLGSDNGHERTNVTAKIESFLAQYRKTWADVPVLLAPLGSTTTVNPDIARHVIALGSHDARERESARQWLLDLLITHRKNWNDLVELLCFPVSPSWADAANPSPPPGVDPGYPAIDIIDTLVATYSPKLTPAQRMATVLWILHTHVYTRFQVTPRLVLGSPVKRCGKTTLIDLTETLVAKPLKADYVTPAVIYRLVDKSHPTFLLDEIDNLGLELRHNGKLRAVFNSGHRRGGRVVLMSGGEPCQFSTCTPVALAGIGKLPLPLMDRAIVIAMQRLQPGEVPRFSGRDPAIDYVFDKTRVWARTVTLNPDPAMPEQIRNHRQADNWRPLIAIADSFGTACGRLAREAAIEFAQMQQDEDAQVLLLHDIRTVFDARNVDRLFSEQLIAALVGIEDAMWSEWRGLHGGQQPHHLSQSELAKLLAPFDIRPKTIWPPQRTPASRSAKGYLRSQFEQAWASYCDGFDDDPAGGTGGTSSQSSNIRHLRSV